MQYKCFEHTLTEGVREESSENKDENETASHWKEMMLNAIGEREETEQEKQVSCIDSFVIQKS